MTPVRKLVGVALVVVVACTGAVRIGLLGNEGIGIGWTGWPQMGPNQLMGLTANSAMGAAKVVEVAKIRKESEVESMIICGAIVSSE